MKKLKLKLIRVNLTPKYTEGALINVNKNTLIYDTLEDTVRDRDANGDLLGEDEGKVYGETAIPYGIYELEVTFSPKFRRDMVLVKNVNHFEGIRLHWGATADNSDGCILGGRKSGNGVLKNTGFTQGMVDLLNKHGGKATLEIV